MIWPPRYVASSQCRLNCACQLVPAAAEHAEQLSDPSCLDFSPLGTCTRIAAAEHRAISFRQLLKVRAFVEAHAVHADKIATWRAASGRHQKPSYPDSWAELAWTDLAPPEYSPTAGQTLNAKRINLYQVTCRVLLVWH